MVSLNLNLNQLIFNDFTTYFIMVQFFGHCVCVCVWHAHVHQSPLTVILVCCPRRYSAIAESVTEQDLGKTAKSTAKQEMCSDWIKTGNWQISKLHQHIKLTFKQLIFTASLVDEPRNNGKLSKSILKHLVNSVQNYICINMQWVPKHWVNSIWW